MSLFGKFVRGATAAASVALGTASAMAQDAVTPPPKLDLPGLTESAPVTPASGFGRRAAPAPCYPAIPTTPCPITGQPMTPPTGEPQPMTPQVAPPAAQQPLPDVGDLSGGGGVRLTTGLNGYIENAAPNTMVRIRFDSGYGSNRPDRGNFFYAKCGCFFPQRDAIGVPLPERNVDYQELVSTVQFAITERFAAFVDVPVRFLDPDVNRNAAGIGDIGFGAKYAFIYNENRIVSAFLRFQGPAGSTSLGLGNGQWFIEPGLLYLEQLNEKWQLFGEFRFMTPLGLRTNFSGNLLRYGLGTSYTVAQGRWGYVAPVAEVVGWSVLSGNESTAAGAMVSASGDTIVNAKLGVRIGLGCPTPGSPFPTRSDLYIGYGRALTGEVWYKDLIRLEFRRFF
jgi:hypothetical protein